MVDRRFYLALCPIRDAIFKIASLLYSNYSQERNFYIRYRKYNFNFPHNDNDDFTEFYNYEYYISKRVEELALDMVERRSNFTSKLRDFEYKGWLTNKVVLDENN